MTFALPSEDLKRTSCVVLLNGGRSSLHRVPPYDVHERTLDVQGKIISDFFVRFSNDYRRIVFLNMDVSEAYKGQGRSRAFIDWLLSRYPSVRRVETELLEDNYEAFAASFRKSENVDRAIRATPFYKVFCRHGFCRILRAEVKILPSVEVILGRPSP